MYFCIDIIQLLQTELIFTPSQSLQCVSVTPEQNSDVEQGRSITLRLEETSDTGITRPLPTTLIVVTDDASDGMISPSPI